MRYRCGVGGCAEEFDTPGQLGGHRSWHALRGDAPERPSPACPSVALYCACGGALTLRGEESQDAAKLIVDAWLAAHDGDAHGPTTANEANLERERRKRRAEERSRA